ncbi:MAG TPA: 16S rRNA (cytidine(1402)-2'-O)-methyltransferase [bacterium]|jgi:16S rRNA (cytidine1402-2'-O)-methyltransferase|nr:16S rRNA (cytidine(1402)-2'-O)-methyltransferase [bacterium]
MSKLTLVATPIGNLGDLSPRAKEALQQAEVLACEDTRHTRKLYEALGLEGGRRSLAYHEYNEAQAAPGLLRLVQEGKRVVLVSDAGLPGLSDPGYRILNLCREKGVAVEVIPGPHAAPLGLLMSGLPTSSYTFKGFVPKKPGARERFFSEEANSAHTLLCYENPLRLAETLATALSVMGERQASIALELTKLHERCLNGTLSTLKSLVEQETPKGEAVLIIAPLPRKQRKDSPDEEKEDS